MADSINLEPTLSFLVQLSQNNDRAWFEQHRTAYAAARDAFEQFVDVLIDEFRVADGLYDLKARSCVARIHRDVRFSKDKSPYKTNMGAMIAPGAGRPPVSATIFRWSRPASRWSQEGSMIRQRSS